MKKIAQIALIMLFSTSTIMAQLDPHFKFALSLSESAFAPSFQEAEIRSQINEYIKTTEQPLTTHLIRLPLKNLQNCIFIKASILDLVLILNIFAEMVNNLAQFKELPIHAPQLVQLLKKEHFQQTISDDLLKTYKKLTDLTVQLEEQYVNHNEITSDLQNEICKHLISLLIKILENDLIYFNIEAINNTGNYAIPTDVDFSSISEKLQVFLKELHYLLDAGIIIINFEELFSYLEEKILYQFALIG